MQILQKLMNSHARGKQVFVRQRLKDMGFEPVQNIIRTSKGQTNESPSGSEWLTLHLCNNLGPRQQHNGKVPAFIGFSELQSPAVSTGPIVQERLVFFFPLRSSDIFRSSGKNSNFLYSSSSFSLYSTLSNSLEMQGSLLRGDHCAETFVDVLYFPGSGC